MAILFAALSAKPDDWLPHFADALPDERIRVHPDRGDPADIDIALVAKPPPGSLTGLPNLRLLCSLWAGVDGLLADPTLPPVPLVRLVDQGMTDTMAETVLTHVLALHRRLPEYRAQQTARRWVQLDQPWARDRRVGVLGLGELGSAAARILATHGFDVAGWSRTPRVLEGIACHAGPDALPAFLARTDILVILLPLTDATRGIINTETLAALPAGASVINVARGGHVVDADLLAALDSGQVGHAVLDVFATEPLPPDHPYWGHPKVTVMPHVAAYSDPRSAAWSIAAEIRRFRAGQPPLHAVDRTRRY